MADKSKNQSQENIEQTSFLKVGNNPIEDNQDSVLDNKSSTADKNEQKGQSKTKKRDFKLMTKLLVMPEEVKVPVTSSDMVVVTKLKDLVSYIFKATEKSPKKFRFTFVNRLHNLGLDVIEKLYRANEINMKGISEVDFAKRSNYQKEAMTDLKILEYITLLAVENECLTFHQYEFIAKRGTECQILLANWIDSDRKRFVKSVQNA